MFPADLDNNLASGALNFAYDMAGSSNFQAQLTSEDLHLYSEPLEARVELRNPWPQPLSASRTTSISTSSQSCDSDPEDSELATVDTTRLSKEELRKHKNRQSAARSRKRTRDRMGQLETLVRQLSAKNRQLEDQVRVLLQERAAFTSQPPQPYAPFYPDTY